MAPGSRGPIDTAALLTAIVQSTDDAIISVDLDGMLTFWNQAAERLYGYSADEALGQPNTIIIPPDRIGDEDEIVRRILQGQTVEPYETIRTRKDGTRVDVSLTVSSIRSSDGRVIGLSKISRDLSSLLRAAQEIRGLLAESRRLVTIVESSDDAIVAKDLHGTIISWNPGAERMFGFTAEEAIGRPIQM